MNDKSIYLVLTLDSKVPDDCDIVFAAIKVTKNNVTRLVEQEDKAKFAFDSFGMSEVRYLDRTVHFIKRGADSYVNEVIDFIEELVGHDPSTQVLLRDNLVQGFEEEWATVSEAVYIHALGTSYSAMFKRWPNLDTVSHDILDELDKWGGDYAIDVEKEMME